VGFKFLHTADWHLWDKHKYSIDGSRFQELVRNAKLIIKFAIKKKVDAIIIVGDIFHNSNPDERLLRTFADIILPAIKVGIQVKIIIGNHDTDGENYALESSNQYIGEMLTPRKQSQFLHIISGNTIYEDYVHIPQTIKLTMIPWQKTMVEALNCANERKHISGRNILFAHCAVSGAEVGASNKSLKTTLGEKYFQGWDYVGLGDYHKYQKVGSPLFKKSNEVYYSGSIIRMDWGERNETKAFNYVEIGDEVIIKKVKLPDIDFIELDLYYNEIEGFSYHHINPDQSIAIIDSGGCEKKIKSSFIKIKVTGKEEEISRSKLVEFENFFMEKGAKNVSLSVSIKEEDFEEEEEPENFDFDFRVMSREWCESREVDKSVEKYLVDLFEKVM
jgi:DNA repair exonuclease SbcCD nuclease subunit